jgi:hypothetical protein
MLGAAVGEGVGDAVIVVVAVGVTGGVGCVHPAIRMAARQIPMIKKGNLGIAYTSHETSGFEKKYVMKIIPTESRTNES